MENSQIWTKYAKILDRYGQLSISDHKPSKPLLYTLIRNMEYSDSKGTIDTARKILKVDHAGEFGAVNIYKSQIFISKLFGREYLPMLEKFLEDEKRHLNLFWSEITRRKGIKCKNYWLCGKVIMACTWAVESIVTAHLEKQLIYLRSIGDKEAYDAVNSILEDEEHHRDIGEFEGGKNIWFSPFRFMVSLFTEAVIRFGMR